MLQGHFINLSESIERRHQIEGALKKLGLSETIRRFPAIRCDTGSGKLSPSERGCLMSHASIIDQAHTDTTLLVLEDDTVLSQRLPGALKILPAMMQKLSLDIIFLGQTVEYSDIKTHIRLLKALDQLQANNKAVTILDASKFYRWGAFAYMLAPQSLKRISASLKKEADQGTSVPIDNFFLRQIRSNKLKAGVMFPYIVGVNADLGTTMQERSHARDHDLHASLVNLYLHGAQTQTGLPMSNSITQGLADARALAICQRVYMALTTRHTQTDKNEAAS